MFPLLHEMSCPHCKTAQQIQIKGVKPHLTDCTVCKKLLVVIVELNQSPNAITLALDVLRVEAKKEKLKSKNPPINIREVA